MYEEQLTYKIRGAVFEVYRTLGSGFLESVYQNALYKELQLQGLNVEAESALQVHYKNSLVGEYRADLIVENKILLKLKAQQEIPQAAEVKLINYLKITGMKLGLLINFTHPKATVKRIVF